MSYPFLMHAMTTKGMSEDWAYYFQHLYPYPTEGAAPTGKANGKWGDDTHPSDNKLGYSDKFTKAIKPSGFHTYANHNFQNLSPDEVYQDDLENFGHGPTQEAGPVYDNYIVITPQPKVIQDRVVEDAASDRGSGSGALPGSADAGDFWCFRGGHAACKRAADLAIPADGQADCAARGVSSSDRSSSRGRRS